jgi:hypothetical protein
VLTLNVPKKEEPKQIEHPHQIMIEWRTVTAEGLWGPAWTGPTALFSYVWKYCEKKLIQPFSQLQVLTKLQIYLQNINLECCMCPWLTSIVC